MGIGSPDGLKRHSNPCRFLQYFEATNFSHAAIVCFDHSPLLAVTADELTANNFSEKGKDGVEKILSASSLIFLNIFLNWKKKLAFYLHR